MILKAPISVQWSWCCTSTSARQDTHCFFNIWHCWLVFTIHKVANISGSFWKLLKTFSLRVELFFSAKNMWEKKLQQVGMFMFCSFELDFCSTVGKLSKTQCGIWTHFWPFLSFFCWHDHSKTNFFHRNYGNYDFLVFKVNVD